MQPTSKELLARLQEAMATKEDIIPEGFKTRAQWEKEWGCSHAHAKNLLKAGESAGLIEVRKFKIKSGMGVAPIPHYRPTKGGKPGR